MFEKSFNHDLQAPPALQLLELYEAYCEFNQRLSFICMALSSMVNQGDEIDSKTARGLEHHCRGLMRRSDEIQKETKRILRVIQATLQANNPDE